MTAAGVLPIDKVAAQTSARAVAEVRKLFDNIKAGHAGTLDPTATGVLPVLLGEATAFTRFLPPQKTYHATICFGAATDTDDAVGEIIYRRAPPCDLAAAVRAILPSFVGEIEQTAPAYSALKYKGRPMYEYARKQIAAPEKRRRVCAFSLNLQTTKDNCADIEVCCGGGFYVRSLARDMGELLGCGAHLSALRRTRCAGFDISRAITVESLARLTPALRRDYVVSIGESLTHLPSRELDLCMARAFAHGQCDDKAPLGAQMRLTVNGRFAGVGLCEAERIQTEKMLSWTRSEL